MPGDLNRVLLIGVVSTVPMQAGKAVRFELRTTQRWTGPTGQRVKHVEHPVLVLHAATAAFALQMRVGDRVFVEGEKEGASVTLGAVHSSLQLLRRASEGDAEPA